MYQQLQQFAVYSVLLLMVMFLAEFVYRYLKKSSEFARKFAHIGSGIVALTYPSYITNHWIVFALTISFTIILFVSKKMGLFQSIFAVGRKSYGELFFVFASWLLFWAYRYTDDVLLFYLPFSVIVFADAFAALVGSKLPIKKFKFTSNAKSIGGSFTFFIIAFLLSFYLLKYYSHLHNILIYSLLHSIILTLVEAFSTKGLDNLTLPVASVIFLLLLN